MSKKKKAPSRNPAKSPVNPLVEKVYRRLVSGVELTGELENHVAPLGDSLITLEQWRYLRGSVVADLALYAMLLNKPSPIDQIVRSEQQRVLVDF